MHRAKIGVKKMSNPAMNPTLEAEEVAMPHCWKPDPAKLITPNRHPLLVLKKYVKAYEILMK